jgi:hypothetical protein
MALNAGRSPWTSPTATIRGAAAVTEAQKRRTDGAIRRRRPAGRRKNSLEMDIARILFDA